MKSRKPGKRISAPEVLNISTWGIWILVDDNEYFLSFEKFPWFRDATVAQIQRIDRPSVGHLVWPALDVDLELGCLVATERYTLTAKTNPASARRAASKTARSSA